MANFDTGGEVDRYARYSTRFLADLGMQSGGAVRVSLGLVTNFADVYRLVAFARTFLDTFPAEDDLSPRRHC
jgi:molybdenum cofactor sulfurtransferase